MKIISVPNLKFVDVEQPCNHFNVQQISATGAFVKQIDIRLEHDNSIKVLVEGKAFGSSVKRFDFNTFWKLMEGIVTK